MELRQEQRKRNESPNHGLQTGCPWVSGPHAYRWRVSGARGSFLRTSGPDMHVAGAACTCVSQRMTGWVRAHMRSPEAYNCPAHTCASSCAHLPNACTCICTLLLCTGMGSSHVPRALLHDWNTCMRECSCSHMCTRWVPIPKWCFGLSLRADSSGRASPQL